jgi:hypothetical protein
MNKKRDWLNVASPDWLDESAVRLFDEHMADFIKEAVRCGDRETMARLIRQGFCNDAFLAHIAEIIRGNVTFPANRPTTLVNWDHVRLADKVERLIQQGCKPARATEQVADDEGVDLETVRRAVRVEWVRRHDKN